MTSKLHDWFKRYDHFAEWVTLKVLREDKTHSTGLKLSDPDIFEKLKITLGKSTLFGRSYEKFFLDHLYSHLFFS